MKWRDWADEKPKHGTQIFVWDFKNQRQILLNALWDPENWKYNPNFPVWAYVVEPDCSDKCIQLKAKE